jgi:hypothetical protein
MRDEPERSCGAHPEATPGRRVRSTAPTVARALGATFFVGPALVKKWTSYELRIRPGVAHAGLPAAVRALRRGGPPRRQLSREAQAVLDLYMTHATNGFRFTQQERQRLKRTRYQGNEPTTPEEVRAA